VSIRVHPESAKRSLVVVVSCKELIMITGRESCSCVQSVVGRPAALRLGKAKMRAVALSELESASLHEVGVASPSDRVKPALEEKTRPRAFSGLPGVKGDSAHRNNHQELGRPCLNLGRKAGERASGSHNRRAVGNRESEGLIVVRIHWSSRWGAKEPWPETSRVRGTWS
jgi:hypothetical protein